MHTVALLGAGKIGEAIAIMLAASGRYTVKAADIDEGRAKLAASLGKNISGSKIDLSDANQIKSFLAGSKAVISALPYWCNPGVAAAAKEVGAHYFDLTEDVATTKEVRALSKSGKAVFMPQCGIAPGFISIAAHDLSKQFDSLISLKLRVGALPLFPTNQLKYALTWSTEGLVNEYCNQCEAIVDGKMTTVQPLEGYEKFTLNGSEYEAFNTSGGVGSLCDLFIGKITALDYKTIRYPGHRDLIQFLMKDLGFKGMKKELVSILNQSLPGTKQDVCIIFVEALGIKNGQRLQRTFTRSVQHGEIAGQALTAIQLSTASGACVPLDLILSNKLKVNSGLALQEDIPLTQFLENEFAFPYR
jgi:saccharopine dehydrogenase-like NADP-dependent oxidoreductase